MNARPVLVESLSVIPLAIGCFLFIQLYQVKDITSLPTSLERHRATIRGVYDLFYYGFRGWLSIYSILFTLAVPCLYTAWKHVLVNDQDRKETSSTENSMATSANSAQRTVSPAIAEESTRIGHLKSTSKAAALPAPASKSRPLMYATLLWFGFGLVPSIILFEFDALLMGRYGPLTRGLTGCFSILILIVAGSWAYENYFYRHVRSREREERRKGVHRVSYLENVFYRFLAASHFKLRDYYQDRLAKAKERVKWCEDVLETSVKEAYGIAKVCQDHFDSLPETASDLVVTVTHESAKSEKSMRSSGYELVVLAQLYEEYIQDCLNNYRVCLFEVETKLADAERELKKVLHEELQS